LEKRRVDVSARRCETANQHYVPCEGEFMGKLLLGLALALMLAGCASDSGNQGGVGDSSQMSSGSSTNQPNYRNTPPNMNMRNWSIDRRSP
jgi:hypothetical protein